MRASTKAEDEIALRDVAARYQHWRGPGLFYLGDTRFHACSPITYFGGMLNVVITVDEFLDAIKSQFNSHYVFEGANESSMRLGPSAINNSGRAIPWSAKIQSEPTKRLRKFL